MSVPACENRRACEGVSSEAEVNPRARRNPLEGAVNPRARRNLLEGAVNPRAWRNLLEGAVNPRARRILLEEAVNPRERWNLLEEVFGRATPVGRGGHRSVGRALCVRLGERCFVLVFCRF
jgi:hypothetical protein